MAPTAKSLAMGAGAAVGVGGLAYGVYYVATRGNLAQITRRPLGAALTDQDLTRWVSRDGNEVRLADNRTGVPDPPPWTHRPYQAPIPPGAHEVPVVSPVRTPLVPSGFNRLTADRVKYLDAVREVLRVAGLGQYDARILMILWANESGWDRSCYGWNLGNVKSQGTVYASSLPEILRTKRVHVTVPESQGVQVFADRVASIDGYHVMPDAPTYARYCDRVVIRSPRYAGAEAALRTGGVDGAAAFAQILSSAGYSPEPASSRVAMFRGAWAASARLCGSRWVR